MLPTPLWAQAALQAWAVAPGWALTPSMLTQPLNLAKQGRLSWDRVLGSKAMSPYKARPRTGAGHPAFGLIRQAWQISSAGVFGWDLGQTLRLWGASLPATSKLENYLFHDL